MIRHVGAVGVIPVTEDGKVIIERQFRYPLNRIVTEIPAGKLDSFTEDRLSAAQRELEEESKRLRLKDSLSIKDIKDNRLTTELHKEKMKQQALRIHAAEKKVEQKRKVMVDLMQERKTHELLKEKAFEQFLMDEKAEESKQIDQLTSYTYGQK